MKLISLNVEFDKHTEKVLRFLEKEKPDIFCAQEIFERDYEQIKRQFGWNGYFSPNATHDGEKEGIAIFSRFPVERFEETLYYGQKGHLVDDHGDIENTTRVLLCMSLKQKQKEYVFMTTHFPRDIVASGQVDNFQRIVFKEFKNVLFNRERFIFAADLNSPRGLEIFDEIAIQYKDNIPQKYESSLDPELHRVGKTVNVMVDCLFTSNHYVASNVRFVSGMSDHRAIVADIDLA